jgi:hypothetical protein
LVRFAFHNELPGWLRWQSAVFLVAAVGVFWRSKKWEFQKWALATGGFMFLSVMVVVAEIPGYETSLRANQTLEPLGQALQAGFQPGDRVVCWGKLPQGLPFYCGPAISAANPAYLGGMDLTQIPFEFPGNREMLGQHLLMNESALADLLLGQSRVWIICYGDAMESFQNRHPETALHLILHSGQCKLFASR